MQAIARFIVQSKGKQMAHVNVRAQDSGAVLPDAESAICQVIALQKWSKNWDFAGESFGRSIDSRQRIDAAIKAKNYAAFKALKRRGFWRVELA
jgi:hypothetical protein